MLQNHWFYKVLGVFGSLVLLWGGLGRSGLLLGRFGAPVCRFGSPFGRSGALWASIWGVLWLSVPSFWAEKCDPSISSWF